MELLRYYLQTRFDYKPYASGVLPMIWRLLAPSIGSAANSKRSYRELIRTGAVCTITEDRGRGLVRLCDATVFKRCAIIAALNEAGWSLAVAGQICTRAALSLPTV